MSFDRPCEYRLEDCPATELLEYAWVFESEVPFECEAPPPRYLIIRGLEYAWYCVDRCVSLSLCSSFNAQSKPQRYNTDIPAWILQDRQAKGDKTDNWRTDSPGEMEQFIRTGERDGATSGLYPGVTFGDTFGDTHGLHSATWPPRRRPVRTEAELELLEQILKESEESSGSDESDGANESSASRSHS